MPRKPSEINLNPRRKKYIKDIFRHLGRFAGTDLDDISPLPDQPFTQQKARRQFPIVTRSAHCNRHASPTNPDFERLFARNGIEIGV